MKKLMILAILSALLLSACGLGSQHPTETIPPTESTATVPSQETTLPATEPITVPPTTQPPETTEPTEPETVPPTTQPPETTEATRPEHSELYIPGLPVEDVIRYFNEICLDAEYINGNSDVSVIQKWQDTIYYSVEGEPTQRDMEVLEQFCSWLNEMPGFPGIERTETTEAAGLRIHFCPKEEITQILGDNFANSDGGVTIWWYLSNNQIYEGTICYATDIEQYIRNSVILEEIYNGLGPLQDTILREDSIVYSGFSTPQSLSEIDQLILKLLYHPDIRGGMDAAQCEVVIRQLYY